MVPSYNLSAFFLIGLEVTYYFVLDWRNPSIGNGREARPLAKGECWGFQPPSNCVGPVWPEDPHCPCRWALWHGQVLRGHGEGNSRYGGHPKYQLPCKFWSLGARLQCSLLLLLGKKITKMCHSCPYEQYSDNGSLILSATHSKYLFMHLVERGVQHGHVWHGFWRWIDEPYERIAVSTKDSWASWIPRRNGPSERLFGERPQTRTFSQEQRNRGCCIQLIIIALLSSTYPFLLLGQSFELCNTINRWIFYGCTFLLFIVHIKYIVSIIIANFGYFVSLYTYSLLTMLHIWTKIK